MIGRNKLKLPHIFLGLFLFLSAETPLSADIDYSVFDEILSSFNEDGFFDYNSFLSAGKLADLRNFLEQAGSISLESLSSREEQALLVNLYNAYVIFLIGEHYPIDSIMDIESPFGRSFCTVGGKQYSLDQIEKELLLANYPDARFHFVLNCAARSCAPLPDEALRAESLDRVLSDAAADFINDSRYNRFSVEKRRQGLRREEVAAAEISEIFRWYEPEFLDQYGSIKNVLRTYLENSKISALIRADQLEIEYLRYDWALNDASAQ